MRCKKGTGHIEMLMGFTLFIGVLIFLFILIKINDFGSEDNSFLLNSLEEKFINSTSSEITRVYVKLDSSPSGCFNIDLSQYGLDSGLGAVVRDLDGNFINASFSGSTLTVDSIPTEFYVYFGEDIGNTPTAGSCDTETSFNLGSFVDETSLVDEKIRTMNQQYSSGYTALKNSLSVGDVYDFAIEIQEIGVIMNRSTPQTANIYAKQKEYLIFKENQFSSEEVIFKIW